MDEEPLALEVAYKVARMELKISIMKEEAKLDPSQFKTKIKEIEGQLDTLQAVKSALTGATGARAHASELFHISTRFKTIASAVGVLR